jgi:hypothetical protein
VEAGSSTGTNFVEALDAITESPRIQHSICVRMAKGAKFTLREPPNRNERADVRSMPGPRHHSKPRLQANPTFPKQHRFFRLDAE